MINIFKILTPVALLLSLLSCGQSSKNSSGADGYFANADTLNIGYAKGFMVMEMDGCRFVEINDLNESGQKSHTYKYALIPRGVELDSIPLEYQVIRTPVERVICMTTLQLSSLIKLGATDRVVGLTSTRYIHDSNVKSGLESGDIRRIGIEGEFDIEVVMDSRAELIFISQFKRGGYSDIADCGITTFNYLGYKESSPLGQAEWIKLVGMMLGMEHSAEQIFRDVESNYLSLKRLCHDVASRPEVMSGELHSGNWYVVGGESYLAQLFRDAGAEYFMDNDRESGGFYVDYESVYAEGYNSDYWRIVNSYSGEYSYDILLASDSRYSDFAPFRNRGVIYCNLRERPFYERTPMEPDVVLSDLIKIFHPELLPEYKPTYYELLK